MTERPLRLPKPTDRLDLGDKLRVSPVCIGLVSTPDAVLAAFDAGINFFAVSADMHWPLYDATRRGIAGLVAAGHRDDIVIAAIAYVTQPEFCWLPFDEVLGAIPGLERIDVTVAGGAYRHEFHRRLPQFREHLRTGHAGARAIGASFHERLAARDAVRDNQVDIAFVRYNPLHRGAEVNLFPHLSRPRASLLYNFTSTHGFNAEDGATAWPPITDWYRFALTQPQLDGLLCAPGTPSEVAALVTALEQAPLTASEQEHIVRLSRSSL